MKSIDASINENVDLPTMVVSERKIDHSPDLISDGQNGKCAKCGMLSILDSEKGNEHEVYDGCIGKISGDVMNACCGHGDNNMAYIQYWNGDRISGDRAVLEQKRTSSIE